MCDGRLPNELPAVVDGGHVVQPVPAGAPRHGGRRPRVRVAERTLLDHLRPRPWLWMRERFAPPRRRRLRLARCRLRFARPPLGLELAQEVEGLVELPADV